MAGNITFTMIKPYALKKGKSGNILAMIIDAGFKIVALKLTHLTVEDSERFYDIHKGQPFFDSLVKFMSSGPIIAAILEKENAVADYRKLIGNTDPKKAEDGTIRKLFAESIQANAVHGSDNDEHAEWEANFFFSYRERFYSKKDWV